MKIILNPNEALIVETQSSGKPREYRVINDWQGGLAVHETTGDLSEHEKELLSTNPRKIIRAIKYYRERTGASLAEAKELCEAYMASHTNLLG